MKKIFSESKQRFSIRKYSIGVASVMLSTLVFVEGSIYAEKVKNNTDSQTLVVAQDKQGERYKESGLESNESAAPTSTSATPAESVLLTSRASAEKNEAQPTTRSRRSKRESGTTTFEKMVIRLPYKSQTLK